jgi:hypothetical protein
LDAADEENHLLVLDSESDSQEDSAQFINDHLDLGEEVVINPPSIGREVKTIEFTAQYEHVRRQKLLESMKDKWSKYNNTKTKE